MVHDFEACPECTQKCLLVHGNKKSGSHIDTSFFKIMFGKQFLQLMELPPRVARILLMSDRRTFLEDSRGEKWKVGISRVDGSLAFQQGWNTFALDHDLEVGDFLIFNYVPGSHFTVKIYDSTGCELNLFESMHQNNRNGDHANGQCHDIVTSTMLKSATNTFTGPDAEIGKCFNEVNGMKSSLIITENAPNDDYNERSKLKRRAELPDDMLCNMNRECGHQQEENRANILDLSSVEMFKKRKSCGSGGSNNVAAVNETHSHHADSSLKLRTEAGSVKIPVTKEVADRVIPSHALETARTEKINCTEYKVKGASLSDKDSSTNMTAGHLSPTLPENPEQNNEIVSGISNRSAEKCQSANASGNDHQVAESGKENDLIDDTCQRAKVTDISKSCDIPITLGYQDKVMEVAENEPMELTSHPFSQEVVPESNDNVMMTTEKESVKLISDPCSQEEVIHEGKDKDVTVIESVIVNLTSDPCNHEVMEIEEALDSTKVDNAGSNINPRETPSDPAEFERTEKYEKSEDNVNKVASDKDSCTETSNHPFPRHSENLEENGETISDTSKTTSDISMKPTKEYQTADQSELLSSNDQVEIPQKEPILIDDCSPTNSKRLTGISESIHNYVTSEHQTHHDSIINEKESVVVTGQEFIPQTKDTIVNEKETVEVILEPCSQKVIPEGKDTIVIQEESVEVTLNPTCQEVIQETKEESLKVFNRVHRQHAKKYIRTAPPDASDLERTQKSDSEVKVRKSSTSDKGPHNNQTSCHLNPIRHVHVEADQTNFNTPEISDRGIKKLMTTDGSGDVQVAVSQKEKVSANESCRQAKKIVTGTSKPLQGPVTIGSQYNSATISKIRTKEFVNLSSDSCSQGIIPQANAQSSNISNKLQSQGIFTRGNDTVLPVVKPEPVEDAGATFPSFTISCVATDRQTFLELPKSLPLPLNVFKGRSKQDRRIVYLQDPTKRLWPVLYIQKFFYRALTNGWEAFSMANNIQPGDQCTIEVTSQTEGICSVDILTKEYEFFEQFLRDPLVELSH